MNAETLGTLGHPAFLAVLGACVGSFLNVVIYRVPKGMSIVRPASRCPQCRKALRPCQNVPLLSWIALRGKCHWCKAPIPVRYPLVEALTAVLFAVAGVTASGPLALALALAFVAAMIAITFIDLDHMIIPDSITIPGTILGVVAAFTGVLVDPLQAVLGIAVGAGGLWAVAVAYRAATGRDGLGGGDIKLLAMVGAFLGPSGAFLTIMIGSVAGTLFAAVFMLRSGSSRTAELPFGTFLAPGALLVLFLGGKIVTAYWNFFV